MTPFPRKLPSRVIIERIEPAVSGGRFCAKRFIDEEIQVKVILLTDGHDKPKGRVIVKLPQELGEVILPLTDKGNDEWCALFKPQHLGCHEIRVEASLDRFGVWREDIFKRQEAGQNLQVDLKIGETILKELFFNETPEIVLKTINKIKSLSKNAVSLSEQDLRAVLFDPHLEEALVSQFDKKSFTQSEKSWPLQIEPKISRFSSWYEFFPRSVFDGKSNRGTFQTAKDRLADVKEMGFNVVYFPPIHPVGKAFRKGKNNTLTPDASDVGSPWAIGSAEGGHKSVLSDLGTLQEFTQLVKEARKLGLEVAMDIAFQCSPDHPYVKEHPNWFKQRPDGTIQYAENPPKKYQDIYPFDFESADWKALWTELKEIVEFWIKQGVKVFRVDNPHTKPFHFWEWLISSVREKNPEVIFLSEAFTRPKIMQYLAKAGFSQSYTYFTWRNSKAELIEYVTELTRSEMSDYYGANFWPNTPDILPHALQTQHAPTYKQRLVLAATLSSSYGIYGPAFELMQHQPYKPGGEEYLDSEKYEVKRWDVKSTQSLSPFIRKVNQIRNAHSALQQTKAVHFHSVNNDKILAYSKNHDGENLLIVVSLDGHHTQSGEVELPVEYWGLGRDQEYEVYDLLTDESYNWRGARNYIELRSEQVAHIFKLNLASRKESK